MQGRSQTAPPSPRRKGRQMKRDTSTITTATNSVFHSRLQENNNNIKWVVESVKRITLFWSAVFFPRDVNGTRTLRQKPFLQCNGNKTDNNSNVRLRATACRITRLWSGGPPTLPQSLAGANLPPCEPNRRQLKESANSVASTRDVLGTASWQPVRRTSPGTWLVAAGGADVTGVENGI